jgi:ABC-type uncharacterized transport system substrate-binding protein
VLAAELTNFYEYAMCGKWLSLLKELAPSVARVAVLQNPDHSSWAGYRQSIATAAPSLGVEAIASGVRSPAEIDIAIDALARAPAGGLLVLPDTIDTAFASLVQLRVGAIISYGTNLADMYRQAGVYAGRILKGEKPADLPVMQPARAASGHATAAPPSMN